MAKNDVSIIQAIFTTGHSAFYFDDQKAIKLGAQQNGFFYQGRPHTSGFTSIRQAGECISVLLILDNGHVAVGDCAAVQYSGAGGRDPLFTHHHFIPLLEKNIAPALKRRSVTSFLSNARFIDQLLIDGKPLHTAIRYGISQALLDATALSHQCSKTEIICQEYSLPIITKPVALFGQSGDDRYTGVDKMILRQVDALPHALINNIDDKLGCDGEKLRDYILWLVARIQAHRLSPTYQPAIHIDVYGTIGNIFDHCPKKVAHYIAKLQILAEPFELYIEGPVDMGNKKQQIDALAAIRHELKKIRSTAKIVADEWCNTYEDIIDFVDSQCCDMVQIKTPDLGSIHHTIEAVLYCKTKQIEAYQGGTCNETDISAKACVHIALATRPERMLVKPGMGFDEGNTIVYNEMSRTISLLNHRYFSYSENIFQHVET